MPVTSPLLLVPKWFTRSWICLTVGSSYSLTENIMPWSVSDLQLMSVLKYLFPVPKPDSRRVMTFANQQDYVSFRHHIYKKKPGTKDIELSEVRTHWQQRHDSVCLASAAVFGMLHCWGRLQVGPRFEMRPYKIVAGTLDQLDTARLEWTIRPYMNTSYKRRFLSTDD